MRNPWLNLAFLAAESQQVIFLRLLKLAAGGPKARSEAHRMTSEKVAALAEAGAKMMTGTSSDRIVSDYRRKVRANARRLAK